MSALRQWLTPLLLLFSTTPGAEVLRDPDSAFFHQSLGDLSEELEIAREEGKTGVLLFFEMDECPFCARMKRDVLNRPRVQDYYREHFRIIPVDIEGDVEIVDFQGQSMAEKNFAFQVNRVRATPVFLFYTLDGEQVARYTGATSGIDEFLWLGEYVVQGVYRDMPFTRYKRVRRQQAEQ
jgi:thioredoxin-related protein